MKLPRSGQSKKKQQPNRRAVSRQPQSTTYDTQLFRRNRTITGSASSDVSATGNHNIKSERTKAHELAKQRRHVLRTLIIVAFGLIVLGILVSQFTASVRVVHAEMNTTAPIDDAAYEQTMADYLARYPFDRFRFLTDIDRLTATLQQAHPEIKAISPSGIDSLGVSRYAVEVRKPVASWDINDTRYFTDEDGVSFEKNYYSKPSVRIVDNSGAQIDSSQAVASARLLRFIGQAVALVEDTATSVTEVSLPANTTRQIELVLKNEKRVRMTIDRGAGEQAEDLERSLNFLKSDGRDYDYIDVRTEGRAYYK